MAATAAMQVSSLQPTTVIAEIRARSLSDGVRIPPAEYEYDLAGALRTSTRFKGMDGIVFDVYDAAACISGSMTAVIQSKDPSMPADYAYPLSNVQAGVLETVLEYCYFHASTTRESISDYEADQWDDDFASLDPRHLCELASAAYYLDIKALVDLTCKTIASMISGKSADEIRSTFHIENDFDGKFLSFFPTDWYAPGNDTRADRYRTRMLTADRHARKLSKQKAQREQDECVESAPIANASVEEIMSYIDGDKPSGPKSGGKRRRGRKKKVQMAEGANNAAASDPKSSDDNRADANSRNQAQSVDVADSPPTTPALVDSQGKDEKRSRNTNNELFASSPITVTPTKSTVSRTPGAAGTAPSTSSSVSGDVASGSKRARRRARKRERKRAAAAATEGTERGSAQESSVSLKTQGSNSYSDELDEEMQLHMDEEVEAFARWLVASDLEVQERRRNALTNQLEELRFRVAHLDSQIARLSKERESARKQIERVQSDIASM